MAERDVMKLILSLIVTLTLLFAPLYLLLTRPDTFGTGMLWYLAVYVVSAIVINVTHILEWIEDSI